jgi:predicted TIM-barrel fold metal-dependent hydrolase/uncharacterized protein (DUF952 family)
VDATGPGGPPSERRARTGAPAIGRRADPGGLDPKRRVDPGPPVPDLLLRDFRPRPRLRVPVTPVARPSLPAIDAHNHLGPTPFAGRWAEATAAELAAVLDASSIAAIVDLDGGSGDRLAREIERWAPLGGRVAVFAGLDYPMWAERADFGEEEARRLRIGIAAGARGLKAWKPLGLTARDISGRIVAVDDPRLDPLWAAAGELGVPVTIHVADPIAFFEPLDAENERYEELVEHPDWHFWPTRPPGRPDLPGFPPFDEIIDGLEALVARHPRTTFVGAHVGCVPEDLRRVGAMLAAHPNWHVDLAARIAELGRQPYSARDFIVRWADRVLFGTDAAPDPAWWAVYARFLETRDESFAYEPPEPGEPPDAPPPPGSQGRWAIHGLGLPAEILRLVYAGNARRLLFRDLPGDAGGHVTLHLLPALRWEAWRADPDPAARYAPAGFEADGFVHCTDGDAEMLVVANRFYAGEPGAFVVLDLDLALAGAPWRHDDPGRLYPHVYGHLRRDAVRGVRPVLRDAEGRFVGFGPGAVP